MTNPEPSAAERAAASEIIDELYGPNHIANNPYQDMKLAESIIAKHMAAERERARRLEEALRAILRDGSECDCDCGDDDDCCVKVGEYCAHCLARAALEKQTP